MKLGIAVIYLGDEDNAPLLALHLRQIRKHTTVPYAIYAAANRLDNRFRRPLEEDPSVRICDIPETDRRDIGEHAYYLDHLVSRLAEDGFTHIAVLHMDSFPVRTGWAEELADKVAAPCAFASLDRIHSACLFFRAEFYERHRPKFLLTLEELNEPAFRDYVKETGHIVHSGITFGHAAHRNGLPMHFLKLTGKIPGTEFAGIYDDTIFHLGGAVRVGRQQPNRVIVSDALVRSRLRKALQTAYRTCLPERIRVALRAPITSRLPSIIESRDVESLREIRTARDLLLDDPETFLRRLRTSDSMISS